MKFSFLKKIRVAVTLIFFLLTALIFLDFTNSLSPGLINSVFYLQFIPSILKFFTAFSIAAIGFLLVVILTMLFGRVYCSSICPLGTLQDIISFIIKKVKKKKYYYHSKEQTWLRYSILLASSIAAVSGFILLLNLLDPFSNSGKIFVNLVRPVLIYVNNLTSSVLESAGIWAVYPYDLKNVSYINLLYPAIFFAVVFVLVYRNGRTFCNTICPVGTLLGFISKVSFIKLTIDESNCRSCKLCERVCKGGCIDKTNKEIDFTRCVSCYNCLTVCPSSGIKFTSGFTSQKNKSVKIFHLNNKAVDARKRRFISKTIISVIALSGINLSQVKIIPKKKSTIAVNRINPVTPPGSVSIEHFTERCTACHLCISACPTQVLQPSLTEYGLTGIFQPTMDFRYGFCNYECKICTDVCPSGAILSLLDEKKKLVQLGKAKFIKENCIVCTENTACGACSEHCPTKAVNMVPYKRIHIPEVNTDYCTGCGACEHACPTKPYKSIYVEGNSVHLAAKKRPVEKIEEKVQEDFPF